MEFRVRTAAGCTSGAASAVACSARAAASCASSARSSTSTRSAGCSTSCARMPTAWRWPRTSPASAYGSSTPHQRMSLSPGAAFLSGFDREPSRSSGDAGREDHPDDRQVPVDATRRAIEQHAVYKADFRMLRPDGGLRWVRSQGRVDREDGEASGMTGAIIDLTREREFAAELRTPPSAWRCQGDRGFRRLGVRHARADHDDLGRAAAHQRCCPSPAARLHASTNSRAVSDPSRSAR